MSDKTIEISLDSAKELLPFLEEKLERLDGEISSMQDEYARTKATVAELKMRLNGSALPFPEPQRERLPKGHAERQIGEMLRALPSDTGMTIADIKKRTNIPYSSIFRILKKKGAGKFVEVHGAWRAVKK